MNNRAPMTPLGHRALQDELKHLLNVERPKIINEVEKAREHGDLRENAEYHAAKEKYGFIQGRIDELNLKLTTAEIIDPARLSGDKVVFGATVVLEDTGSGENLVYQIVGIDEANVKNGKINYQSPLAKSLIGKHLGDDVSVQTPKGQRAFEILEVKFI